MAAGPLLGTIADDVTGGTDVAAAYRRAGLRTLLRFGVPGEEPATGDADAIVVALKTRTIPVAEAVARSRTALAWLRRAGARRIVFKICSTFDSTDAGNIGPVADALLDDLGATFQVVTPAAPEHGRTVYHGHLFVGDRLVSETSMRHHPLTPMTDPDLVRVLGRQTPHVVALLGHPVVAAGPDAVRAELARLRDDGVRHTVADAIADGDLRTLVEVAVDLPLVTGAAGLARAIAEHVTSSSRRPAEPRSLPPGPTLVLAGSQSTATRGQIEHASATVPTFHVDVRGDPDRVPREASAWLDEQPGSAVIAAAPPDPDEPVAPERAALIEQALATIAAHAAARGIRRFVIAGGETSGAVIEALGVDEVEVGAEEAIGVPWLRTPDGRLALLLKSGNFGPPDLFTSAIARTEA